jgi:hypothetical protein
MSGEIVMNYHDAEIFGVTKGDAPGDLIFAMKLEDGTKKTLTFGGCEMFRIVDFTSQNIVSRIALFNGESADESILVEKLRWVSSLCDASSYLNEDGMQSIIRRIRENKLTLVIVEPSAGAEIVVLCRNIRDIASQT